MTVLLGRTSSGTTGNFSNAGDTIAWPFVASASGQLAVIKAQTKVANATATGIRMGVWANGAGVPGTLLAVQAVDDLTAARGTGVFQATLASPVSIVSGTTYWLSVFAASEGWDFQGTTGTGWKEETGDHLTPWTNTVTDTTDAIIWGEDAAATIAATPPSPLLSMLVQGGAQKAKALLLMQPAPVQTAAVVASTTNNQSLPFFGVGS